MPRTQRPDSRHNDFAYSCSHLSAWKREREQQQQYSLTCELGERRERETRTGICRARRLETEKERGSRQHELRCPQHTNQSGHKSAHTGSWQQQRHRHVMHMQSFGSQVTQVWLRVRVTQALHQIFSFRSLTRIQAATEVRSAAGGGDDRLNTTQETACCRTACWWSASLAASAS